MLTMYEKPKKIKIAEVLKMISSKKKPVQRFEYGDFDNWTTAIIDAIKIDLRYTHFKDEMKIRMVNTISLAYEYVYPSTADAEGYYNASRHPFTGYSDINTPAPIEMKDIFNTEIEIAGEWEETKQ